MPQQSCAARLVIPPFFLLVFVKVENENVELENIRSGRGKKTVQPELEGNTENIINHIAYI